MSPNASSSNAARFMPWNRYTTVEVTSVPPSAYVNFIIRTV